jgi:hypothetical protein
VCFGELCCRDGFAACDVGIAAHVEGSACAKVSRWQQSCTELCNMCTRQHLGSSLQESTPHLPWPLASTVQHFACCLSRHLSVFQQTPHKQSYVCLVYCLSVGERKISYLEDTAIFTPLPAAFAPFA